MPSTLDYALMAGASYIDTRGPINRFPAPQNWVSFKHESGASGFEAISFVKGTEEEKRGHSALSSGLRS